MRHFCALVRIDHTGGFDGHEGIGNLIGMVTVTSVSGRRGGSEVVRSRIVSKPSTDGSDICSFSLLSPNGMLAGSSFPSQPKLVERQCRLA